MRQSRVVLIAGFLFTAVAGAIQLQGAGPQAAPAAQLKAASPARAFLDKNCVVCHSEKLKTAGLVLENLDVDHVAANAETWEKVVRKLRAGMMPPASMPRPPQEALDAFVS